MKLAMQAKCVAVCNVQPDVAYSYHRYLYDQYRKRIAKSKSDNAIACAYPRSVLFLAALCVTSSRFCEFQAILIS